MMKCTIMALSALSLGLAFMQGPESCYILSDAEKANTRGGADCEVAIADASDCCGACKQLSGAPSARCQNNQCGGHCEGYTDPVVHQQTGCTTQSYGCPGMQTAYATNNCTGQAIPGGACDVAFGITITNQQILMNRACP